jgi:serine protease AprX
MTGGIGPRAEAGPPMEGVRPEPVACGLCGSASLASELAEAGWAGAEVAARLVEDHPEWRRDDGACPACVQQALLRTLLSRGEAAFHRSVQDAWPLDAEAAFGALPTPLRLHVDPRFTGRGVTIALVDAAFHPHPDLVRPSNRIRAFVDVSGERVELRRFGADEEPRWPRWDAGDPGQWHGLMTSATAAGNGWLSHGLYRGVAPEADLVLVQVAPSGSGIGNAPIARALAWLARNAAALGVRVVSASLGGEAVSPLAGNPVDAAVAELVAQGVSVIVASGNDGARRLVPPATSPAAVTVGGLDDGNTFDHEAVALWHGNYGEAADGASKPELVAPSLWVVAPLLPGTAVAAEAGALFERRAARDRSAEPRIAHLKLVTPHYQHVEGTSFAAPLVAGVVACMLEARPELSPRRVRELLLACAHPVPGAPVERQGAGAVDAGRAVTLALADRHSRAADEARTPRLGPDGVEFLLHDHAAREVLVFGSWDGWRQPLSAVPIEPGLWCARLSPRPDRLAYKFRLDGTRWLTDPGNPARQADGLGGWNSVFEGASGAA